MNYLQGDGKWILAAGILSLIFTLRKEYKTLWWTGIASLGSIALTVMKFMEMHSRLGKEIEVELTNNPFKGLAYLAKDTIQLQWGFALIVIGTILIIATAKGIVKK